MSTIWVCSDCGSGNVEVVYYGATVVIGQNPDGTQFLKV